METTNEVKDVTKKVKDSGKNTIILKKLDADTAKLLSQLKEKTNKKVFGRKVRDTEIIGIALKQVTSDHIKTLQEQTYSQKDRLAIAHEDYQKHHGKVSLDQFIGKLLKGELSLKG